MPDKPKIFGQRPRPAKLGGSTALRDNTARYQRQRSRLLDAEPLCRYCRAQGRITPASVLDHILALSLGGSNDPDNLAPACSTCNAAKGVDELRYLRRGYDLASVRLDPALSRWFALAKPITK